MDVSASVILVRAPSEEAAIDLVRDDVYMRNGVWVEVRARAFGRVTRECRGGSCRRVSPGLRSHPALRLTLASAGRHPVPRRR